MASRVDQKVMRLLKSGVCSVQQQREELKELEPAGKKVLHRIAEGEQPVEHIKLRGNAILALGWMEDESSLEVLQKLIQTEEPPLQLRALRAVGRWRSTPFPAQIRALIRDPHTRPDVALAAARVSVKLGNQEVVSELEELRTRLLPLVSTPRSPSIVSLDRLIAKAEKQEA
ncbi:HEAT repeat domain-containing protein [Halobacillus mangrovi]|uniref:HEAT repeat domain-containing protein n=1 Tax=Halobacillus mangrovi TaxID=402384 RepID=UPI003D96E6C0